MPNFDVSELPLAVMQYELEQLQNEKRLIEQTKQTIEQKRQEIYQGIRELKNGIAVAMRTKTELEDTTGEMSNDWKMNEPTFSGSGIYSGKVREFQMTAVERITLVFRNQHDAIEFCSNFPTGNKHYITAEATLRAIYPEVTLVKNKIEVLRG